jgi:hypothetical protein
MVAVYEKGANDQERGEKEDADDEADSLGKGPLVRCVSWCRDMEMECGSVKKPHINSQSDTYAHDAPD